MSDRTNHQLKTWPSAFEAVWDGRKHFEARKFDRDFAVGDTLHLLEWCPTGDGDGHFTGRELTCRVTYLLSGRFGVPGDIAVMSIANVERARAAERKERRRDNPDR